MKKIVVKLSSGKEFTYLTDLKVRIGTKVLVPAPFWSAEPNQKGKVKSLTSEYNGECIHVLSLDK